MARTRRRKTPRFSATCVAPWSPWHLGRIRRPHPSSVVCISRHASTHYEFVGRWYDRYQSIPNAVSIMECVGKSARVLCFVAIRGKGDRGVARVSMEMLKTRREAPTIQTSAPVERLRFDAGSRHGARRGGYSFKAVPRRRRSTADAVISVLPCFTRQGANKYSGVVRSLERSSRKTDLTRTVRHIPPWRRVVAECDA
jgi:hypothetical protein